jgi:hypothetical protein
MVLAVSTFDDRFLARFFPSARRPPMRPRWPIASPPSASASWSLSQHPAHSQHAVPRQVMNTVYNRFHLVGTYGAFGSITRPRYEVIVEGTDERRAGLLNQMARVRIQRASPAAWDACLRRLPLSPAPRLADVVRGPVVLPRATLVRSFMAEAARRRPRRCCRCCAPIPSRTARPARCARCFTSTISRLRRSGPRPAMVEARYFPPCHWARLFSGTGLDRGAAGGGGPFPAVANNACVVGSGPNGLTAAIVLAKAGLRTTVFEAQPTIGGGARSAELTLPGFVHDVCSAVHPLAVSSPVFASFPLAEHGLEWIQPPLPLAHPLDDGSAAVLEMPLEETCARLGADGAAYRRAIAPLVRRWRELVPMIQAPLFVCPPIRGCWRASERWPCGRRRLGPAALPHRSGARAVCGHCRAFRAAARCAGIGRLRMGAGRGRTRRRLAHPAGRLAGHRQRAGVLLRIARRTHRHQHPHPVARRIGRCRAGPLRCDSPAVRGHRRQPFAGPLQPPIGGLPLRPRAFSKSIGP